MFSKSSFLLNKISVPSSNSSNFAEKKISNKNESNFCPTNHMFLNLLNIFKQFETVCYGRCARFNQYLSERGRKNADLVFLPNLGWIGALFMLKMQWWQISQNYAHLCLKYLGWAPHWKSILYIGEFSELLNVWNLHFVLGKNPVQVIKPKKGLS